MKIVKATVLGEYRLALEFDNGERGTVDVSGLVGRGVFQTWSDPKHFEQVSVTAEGAVEWPGQLDLCPDSLYLQMTGKKAEDLFPALGSQATHA